jgi:hypothetical protein
MGLSNVHQHFIDNQGNKFFTDFNQVYGELIRQIQTPDGQIFDACNGESFDLKMDELGMIKTIKSGWMVFYFSYENIKANKFTCQVYSIFKWITDDKSEFSRPANIYTKTNIINGCYDFENQKVSIDNYENLSK